MAPLGTMTKKTKIHINNSLQYYPTQNFKCKHLPKQSVCLEINAFKIKIKTPNQQKAIITSNHEKTCQTIYNIFI